MLRNAHEYHVPVGMRRADENSAGVFTAVKVRVNQQTGQLVSPGAYRRSMIMNEKRRVAEAEGRRYSGRDDVASPEVPSPNVAGRRSPPKTLDEQLRALDESICRADLEPHPEGIVAAQVRDARAH